jgi:putative PIN family toxin of toxin-antitoxin system
MKVVIDTNVMISALRSPHGASAAILRHVVKGRLRPVLSVPLLLEYEEVMKRPGMLSRFSHREIDGILFRILQSSLLREIFFTWRPLLRDPDDEMLVDVAVSGGASWIVTQNIRDLAPASIHGIQVVTPQQFIQRFGP